MIREAVCRHDRVVWTVARGFRRCPMCEIEKQPFFLPRYKKLLTPVSEAVNVRILSTEKP